MSGSTSSKVWIPTPLGSVVMKCLAKRPEDRWQTAGEVATELDPLVTPERFQSMIRMAAEQMRTLSYTHLFAGKTHEPAIVLAEKLKAMVKGALPSSPDDFQKRKWFQKQG